MNYRALFVVLVLAGPVVMRDQWSDFVCGTDSTFAWYGGRQACFIQNCSYDVAGGEKVCNDFGMHLASVHTEEESAWISSEAQHFRYGGILIGIIPGQCAWTDGTPFDFKYFDGYTCGGTVKSFYISPGNPHWIANGGADWCSFPCVSEALPTSSIATASPPPSYPPPSPSSPTVLSNACGDCSIGSVWLDIMFLVDSTQTMQQIGINEVQATIRSTLRQLRMSREEVRAGVIVYGDTVDILNPLGSINSDADAHAVKIPYRAQYGTNMEAAIVRAINHFDEFPGMDKARKVIVVFASGYREGSYPSPVIMASAFRAEGGVIISVDFSPSGSGPVAMLGAISSPGYELNRTAAIEDEFQRAFCDVNCFCPSQSTGYTSGSPLECQGRCIPSGGCYRAAELAAVQEDAEDDCLEGGGHLVSIHNDEQQLFVTALFKPKTMFWIGLNGRTSNWTDGTLLDYSHWSPGQPFSTGDCVYSTQYKGFTTGWYMEDCIKGLPYACSIRPCSAAIRNCSP